MGRISASRLGAVRSLIEQAPDKVVQGLDTALKTSSGSMAEVRDLVSDEMIDRRVRTAVFAPLVPLCQARGAPAILPPASPRVLWRALKIDVPSSIAEAKRATLALRRDDGPPPIYDELCRRCADGLRERDPPFDEAARLLEAGRPGSLDRLVAGLDLAPLGRSVMPRISGWARGVSGESAAAVRVAFKDAAEFDLDAAPTFMEIINAQLPEPWLILRIISAVMDRPSDRYMAGSEVASFGERLLDDIDRRLEAVRRFDLDSGPTAGAELADSVQLAGLVIAEFEQWLDISRDGPWGRRLAKARKAMASNVEALLRLAPPAVTEALPTHERAAGKTSRLVPDAGRDLDPDALRRAYAVLTFLSETRSSADHGGFASTRARIIEELDKQIDLYAEDLLASLHEGEADRKRLSAFIAATADFLSLVRDPKAGELVRRRAAAA
jgi:hypothetical protein